MKPTIRIPSKLIPGLPLLESLRCVEMVVSSDQGRLGDGSFGSDLSKLQHLSTLHLVDIEGIDEHWCLYNWPKMITNLTISGCSGISPSSAYQIIHHIAPCLKNLRLIFEHGDGSWEVDPSWNPGRRFSLPLLTDLALCTRNKHLLDSFQECKSLGCLQWIYKTSEHCKTLRGILFRPTWPQLKELTVTPHYWRNGEDHPDPDQAIEDELASFEEYCKQANIKGTIRRHCR